MTLTVFGDTIAERHFDLQSSSRGSGSSGQPDDEGEGEHLAIITLSERARRVFVYRELRGPTAVLVVSDFPNPETRDPQLQQLLLNRAEVLAANAARLVTEIAELEPRVDEARALCDEESAREVALLGAATNMDANANAITSVGSHAAAKPAAGAMLFSPPTSATSGQSTLDQFLTVQVVEARDLESSSVRGTCNVFATVSMVTMTTTTTTTSGHASGRGGAKEAAVEVEEAGDTFRTHVARSTLNPLWNSASFPFCLPSATASSMPAHSTEGLDNEFAPEPSSTAPTKRIVPQLRVSLFHRSSLPSALARLVYVLFSHSLRFFFCLPSRPFNCQDDLFCIFHPLFIFLCLFCVYTDCSLFSYGSDGSTFLGGVLIDIDAAFRSARRHAVDEWFVLAPLRSAPSVTGDVRLRIQYARRGAGAGNCSWSVFACLRHLVEYPVGWPLSMTMQQFRHVVSPTME